MGGRYALLVSCGDYKDQYFTPLTKAKSNIDDLKNLLENPAIGNFEVKTILNPSSGSLRRSIDEFFSGRKKDDTLLLYYSGHGEMDKRGRLYLTCIDSIEKLLPSTGVSCQFVNNIIIDSNSKKSILLLDCCNSGAFKDIMGNNFPYIINQFPGPERGRYIISATGKGQPAYEGNGKCSIFTQAIIDGLKSGEADINGDGYISIDELYDYVYDKIKQHQTPEILIPEEKGGGSISIAKSVRIPSHLNSSPSKIEPSFKPIKIELDKEIFPRELNVLKYIKNSKLEIGYERTKHDKFIISYRLVINFILLVIFIALFYVFNFVCDWSDSWSNSWVNSGQMVILFGFLNVALVFFIVCWIGTVLFQFQALSKGYFIVFDFKDKTYCVNEGRLSSQFVINDVLDWQGLLIKLKERNTLPQKRIWLFLDSNSKRIVESWDVGYLPDLEQKKIIISALNKILCCKNFYEPSVFKQNISPREEVTLNAIFSKKYVPFLPDLRINYANRTLLESVYSSEILKHAIEINTKIKLLKDDLKIITQKSKESAWNAILDLKGITIVTSKPTVNRNMAIKQLYYFALALNQKMGIPDVIVE